MRKWIAGAALAAAVALGIAWTLRARGDEGLVLSGAIESRSVEIGSLLGGRVAAVHVEEGATVAAGQPVVTFETDLVGHQIAEQRGRVAEAEAVHVRALRGPRQEEVSRARTESEEAERERARLAALVKEGIVARQEYDTAAARAAVALERRREAERGTRPEDKAAAAAAVERERARLAWLERQGEEAVVRAPAAGVIESLDLRPGDLVAAGRPVASLLEPSQLWVKVYVPEPKLGLVRIGQPASVSVDTWPDRRFEGRVVEIGDRAEYTPRNVQTVDQRSEQVFAVRVAVSPSPDLKPGMSALVRLGS
jgi:multidrug resistance efflux pump